MHTILLPTDFSAVSKNTAKYAFNLAAELNVKKVVLYHAYQAPPVITETTLPALPYMHVETMKEISEEGMQTFRRAVEVYCPAGVEIECKTEYAVLDNDIEEVCKSTGAELIVMGVTAVTKIEEALIGTTAVSVIKNTKLPVIVVPGEVQYRPIKNVILACDFKKVAETTPVDAIKKILIETKATLHVLNIYEKDKEDVSSKADQQQLLKSLLQEFNPQFHFEDNHDFIKGINSFVDKNNIDLIITIPKKHGLFEGLFTERHSKKLAYHSHVPLMYVHQEDL